MNVVEIMSARNTRATAHVPRSQRTSTRPLPKSWTPNRPVSRCPQTVNAVHSSLWTKGAELKQYIMSSFSSECTIKTPYYCKLPSSCPQSKSRITGKLLITIYIYCNDLWETELWTLSFAKSALKRLTKPHFKCNYVPYKNANLIVWEQEGH